ncbi:MAG: pyridoxine 5'-phosphate synthase [Saprospiraceae bacterium]|nr:pyridoxine 5'-phosphate synthase [Saprospiraceae bacterium]
MCKLSVNINKVALLRNSRGANLPDLVQVAKDCEEFGAHGITVHPRPDERHVRSNDLDKLKEVILGEFNIEGFPSPGFIKKVLQIQPHQVTLVPDPPTALTSNSGWDTIKHLDFLKSVVGKFKEKGIRVSIFLNPDPGLIESAYETGTDRVELYTGDYSNGFIKNKSEFVKTHVQTALEAQRFGIGLNAGHDLNLDNLQYYREKVPGLLEVSIGHALICDALYFGLQNTISMYLRKLI